MRRVKISKSTTELFLTDFHFPTEDRAVFQLATQVIKDVNPDILWLNGDMMDFKSISSFPTNPKDKSTLSRDLKHGQLKLQELRNAAPNAQLFYKDGNHERRLQSFLWNKAPELSDLEDLELASLLRLRDLNAAIIQEDEKAVVGQLWHLHGHEIGVGLAYPAKVMMQKANTSVIFGHTHRFSVFYQNALDGTTRVAWSIGCGQVLEVDYDVHPQWTQGFAKVEYTKTGLFQVSPIAVFNQGNKKCCMVDGKLYSV